MKIKLPDPHAYVDDSYVYEAAGIDPNEVSIYVVAESWHLEEREQFHHHGSQVTEFVVVDDITIIATDETKILQLTSLQYALALLVIDGDSLRDELAGMIEAGEA